MSLYMAGLQYKVECPVLHMTILSCTSWTNAKRFKIDNIGQYSNYLFQDESETEKKGACPLGCALVNINSRETCKTWKILQKFACCDR